MAEHKVKLRTPGDVGLALHQARMSLGLTQKELAAQLQIPQSTVSEMESGKSTIYLRHLLEMARATGLNISAEWTTPVSPIPGSHVTESNTREPDHAPRD